MPGVQELVRAQVVLAVDPQGQIAPIKNVRGPLTTAAAIESFVAAMSELQREQFRRSLEVKRQKEHTATSP